MSEMSTALTSGSRDVACTGRLGTANDFATSAGCSVGAGRRWLAIAEERDEVIAAGVNDKERLSI